MEEKIFSSRTIKGNQLLILCFTTLFVVVDLIFSIIEFNLAMLVMFILFLNVTFFLNYFTRKIFEVNIRNGVITVENIWSKRNYPLSELSDIRLVKFTLPFIFNPYIKIILKDKKEILTIIPNRIKIYFSKGGVKNYIINLKNELLAK